MGNRVMSSWILLGQGRWHCLRATEQAVGTMPALDPWGPRGGGQEQLISSRRSAVRGPQTHKPFIGVSGGETRMWTFIYFGFHFSLLFLTCILSSITRFLKKQGPLSSGEGSLCFSVPKKKGFYFVLLFKAQILTL